MSEHKLTRETMAARALVDEYRDAFADDETVHLDMIEGETGLFDAIDSVLSRIAEINGLCGAIVLQSRALSERKARLERQEDRLRSALLRAMAACNLQRMERPAGTLSRKALKPLLVVDDVDALPAAFVRTKREADKTAINSAFSSGSIEVLPGTHLSNGGESLAINPK